MKSLKMRDGKGITLIALVLTIIILLLLAGISISMLSGQDGILTKASKAREEASKAEDYEEIVLLAHEALVEGLGKVDLSEGGVLDNALGSDYNYLGEGLVEKNGKYYAVYEDGTVIKAEVKVGDRITYTPPSVTDVKWSAEKSGLVDLGIKDKTLDNTLDVSDENSFKVTSWRVLSIEDGKVNLISENPTTGKVYLGDASGYNNAVKLLNVTCHILYGDATKGIEGRSVKIEDIEGLITKEGLAELHSYTSSVKYGEKDSKPYTINNFYPIIYANEKLSVINNGENETGLGVSEQKEYYTDGATQPIETADGTQSIQPYQTCWYMDLEYLKVHLGVTGDMTTTINYELVMPKQEQTTYWIATRAISTFKVYCDFLVRGIKNGNGDAIGMYYSSNGYGGEELPLRPVVSISIENLKLSSDGVWSVK